MMNHFNDSVESVVFAPTYDKNRCVIAPNDNVIVSECFKKWDRLFFSYKQRKIIKAIEGSVDVGKQDCIHAYTLFTDGNVAYRLSSKYNKPYVVAVRNTDVNVFFKHMVHLRWLGIQIIKNASAVFFLSPVYQKRVIEKYVPTEFKDEVWKKSYIIPNGIDDFWLKNRSDKNTLSTEKRIKEKKELNCIYVGSIDTNKNAELTLKSLDLLNNSGWNCNLTAIGRIDDKKVFRRLSSYSFFKYIKPKEKEELIDYYRKSDIFVMPSHTETFGLVYAEAMSQGLPVIYTRGQGFDGQFNEGEVGYSVECLSPEDISDKIKKIVNNYSGMSKRCFSNSLRFNWNDITNKYLRIYQSIII